MSKNEGIELCPFCEDLYEIGDGHSCSAIAGTVLKPLAKPGIVMEWTKTNIISLKPGYYWHWVEGLPFPLLLHIGQEVKGLVTEKFGEGYYLGPIEPPTLPTKAP